MTDKNKKKSGESADGVAGKIKTPAGHVLDEVDVQIGAAWSQHYRGEHAPAIQDFKEIVERHKDNVDANYGLALAYKGAGQKAEAAEGFRRTKAILDANPITADDNDELNSRYMMLLRLCEQNIVMLA